MHAATLRELRGIREAGAEARHGTHVLVRFPERAAEWGQEGPRGRGAGVLLAEIKR